MSTIEKLIKRMLTRPKDFEESELDRVFKHFHYRKLTDGGSGLKYINDDDKSMINFHSPHKENAQKAIKDYVLKKAIEELKRKGKI